MKVGDLVRVSFGYDKYGKIDSVTGLFVSHDAEYPARAHVFWEGEVYSTPLDQLEVISESR